MKRLLAVLLLACLLAGCTEQGAYIPTGGGFQEDDQTPSQSQTQVQAQLRLAYDQNGSFHPYTATDLNNRSLLPLIYQGLFAVDSSYKVTPILHGNTNAGSF